MYENGVCDSSSLIDKCKLGIECEPMVPYNEECNDGVITYCLAGKFTDLDCRDYGFGGCDTAIDSHQTTVAFCTP